jgi:hypothetical protein
VDAVLDPHVEYSAPTGGQQLGHRLPALDLLAAEAAFWFSGEAAPVTSCPSAPA